MIEIYSKNASTFELVRELFRKFYKNELSTPTNITYKAQVLAVAPCDELPLSKYPQNTILARVLIKDLYITDENIGTFDSRIFYPAFGAHIQIPIKPGEFVWVVYTDAETLAHGYWLFKSSADQNANYSEELKRTAESMQKERNIADEFENREEEIKFNEKQLIRDTIGNYNISAPGSIDVEYIQDAVVDNEYNELIEYMKKDPNIQSLVNSAEPSDEDIKQFLISNALIGSFGHIVEDVPEFKKRLGDHKIEGSNNAIIILGMDRPSDLYSGYAGKGKGKNATIHGIVGRENEDPDFETDPAFFYFSQKTDADSNLQLDLFTDLGDRNATPAILLKGDNIRIIARDSLRIQTNNDIGIAFEKDGSFHIKQKNTKAEVFLDFEGNITFKNIKKVHFGDGADNPLVLYNKLKEKFDDHKHITPTGLDLTGPLIMLDPTCGTDETETKILVKVK